MSSKRYVYLVVACLIMLVLGLIYAWSIFVVPLEQEFGWNRTQTSFTFTIMLCCFTIGQATGSAVGRRLGVKRTILVMGAILFAGFVLASFTNSLPWLYLTFGAVCGYPIGCCLNNTLNLSMQWFPDKSAFASGIVVMGFGFSSLLLGSLANAIIAALGWRWAFRILALCALVLIVVLGSLLKTAPEGYKPEGWVPKSKAQGSLWGYTRAETLKTWKFWVFWVWFVALHFGGFMVLSAIAPYAIACGMAPAVAATCMGAYSVFNGIGRPCVGFLGDKLGKRTIAFACSVLMGGGLLLVAFLPTVMDPFAGTTVGAVIMGLGFGGSIPLSVATMREYFGPKHSGDNIGLIATADLPAGILGPMVGAAIFASTGTYFTAFVIAGVTCLASMVLLAILGKPVPKGIEE